MSDLNNFCAFRCSNALCIERCKQLRVLERQCSGT